MDNLSTYVVFWRGQGFVGVLHWGLSGKHDEKFKEEGETISKVMFT